MIQKNERKRNIILLMREHPDWTHQEIAKHLGVDRATVSRDLSELTRDLQKMNSEAFQLHWQRMLMEIAANKQLCMEMLKDAHASKRGSGSRWMEELSKIMMLEMKLLGLDKFDPTLAVERKPFDKTQRDAAIEAAVKGYEIGRQACVDPDRLLVKHDPAPAPDAESDAKEEDAAEAA